MTFSKYRIHHLDLSADVQPVLDVSDTGHYFVYWYKSIPLGEAYLFYRSAFTIGQFWQECIKAIKPALLNYARQNSSCEEIFFPREEPMCIREVCAQVLSGLHPRPDSGSCDVSVASCTRNWTKYMSVITSLVPGPQ